MLTIPRKPVPHEIKRSEAIRYQRSDGTFKVVQLYYDFNEVVVKKNVIFGIPGQGVFGLNSPNGPLEFHSAMPPKEKTSYVRDDDGHSYPSFVRDDTVQGYRTYVLRFQEDDGGYYEMYCAPELDNEPVLTVSMSPGSVGITDTVEVIPGDPDDKAFGPLPNFLVSYEFFKSKIAITEKAGNHEIAEAMRRELNEQIAKENL